MIKTAEINEKLARRLLPKRDADGNKGTFGKVLLVCGSRRMTGCCALSTMGALRSGAGLVTLAFPEGIYTTLTSRLTENLFLPLPEEPSGSLSEKAFSDIFREALTSDVVMIGPGLGNTPAVRTITTELISLSEVPLILDADSLNSVSKYKEVFLKAKSELLLTPHPGEFSRLTGKSIPDIQADRVTAAASFCSEYGVNLLLKGRNTVVCNSNGTAAFINTTGNTGLSKGGSGDLLSGIIAGLAPNSGSLFEAACLGAYIHGLTADILRSEKTEFSMLPTDCLDALPRAFKKISE